MSLFWIDSLNLQTISSVGGGIFDGFTGTTPSLETTIVPPGEAASMKCTTGATASASNITVATNVIVGRCYFYLDSLPPTDTITLIQGTNASGNFTMQVSASGIRARIATTSGVYALPTLNAWHRMDYLFDASAATSVISWKLDGVTQFGITLAQTSVNITNMRFGWGAASADTGVNAYLARIALANASGDYPLGAGRSKIFIPNGKGTHVPGSGLFKDDGGTTVTDAADTTSYQKIDEVPPNSTDYVAQTVIDSSGYLEYAFADLDSADQTPTYVQAMAAIVASASGSQVSAVKMYDGGTISTGVIGTIGNVGPAYYGERLATAPSGGAWTTAKFNALKVRWGFSSDITPNPRLSALFLIANVPMYDVVESATVTTTTTASAIETEDFLDSATVVPTTSATAVEQEQFVEAATITCTATATASEVYSRAAILDAATVLTSTTPGSLAEGKQYADITAIVTHTTRVQTFAATVDDFFLVPSSNGLGPNYGAYTGASTNYTIDTTGGALLASPPSGVRSFMYLNVDTDNVIAFASFNPVQAPAVSSGVTTKVGLLLQTDATEKHGYWCRANLISDSSIQVVIQRQNSDGTTTNLTAVNNTVIPAGLYVPGRLIRVKASWITGTVFCKVWLDTQSEPIDYQVQVDDSVFTHGATGVKTANGDINTQTLRVLEFKIRTDDSEILEHTDFGTPTITVTTSFAETYTTQPHTSLDNKTITLTTNLVNLGSAEKLVTNDKQTVQVNFTAQAREGHEYVDTVSVGHTYLGLRAIPQTDVPNVGDTKNATQWTSYVEDTKLIPGAGRGIAFRNAYSNMNVADIGTNGAGWPAAIEVGAAGRNEISYVQIHCRRFTGGTPTNPVSSGDSYWDSSAPNLVGTELCVYRGSGVPGDFDSTIIAIGNKYKAWGHPFWFCFHHEFADDFVSQGYNSRTAAAVGWGNAFNRWRQLWQPLNITNLLGYVVNMTDDCYDGSIAGYPDAAYNAINFTPDFVGVDSYVKAGKPWRSFATMLQPSRDYALSKGIPLFIGELGFDPETGDGTLAQSKGQWYRDMVIQAKAWNNIAAICFQANVPPVQSHLDYESHPSLQADATQSFINVFSDPYFNPAQALPPTITVIVSYTETRFHGDSATITNTVTPTAAVEQQIAGDAAIVEIDITARSPQFITEEPSASIVPTFATVTYTEEPPAEQATVETSTNTTGDESVNLTDLAGVVITFTSTGIDDVTGQTVDADTVTTLTSTSAFDRQIIASTNDYLLDVTASFTHWSVTQTKRFSVTQRQRQPVITETERWSVLYKGRGLLREEIS